MRLNGERLSHVEAIDYRIRVKIPNSRAMLIPTILRNARKVIRGLETDRGTDLPALQTSERLRQIFLQHLFEILDCTLDAGGASDETSLDEHSHEDARQILRYVDNQKIDHTQILTLAGWKLLAQLAEPALPSLGELSISRPGNPP